MSPRTNVRSHAQYNPADGSIVLTMSAQGKTLGIQFDSIAVMTQFIRELADEAKRCNNLDRKARADRKARLDGKKGMERG